MWYQSGYISGRFEAIEITVDPVQLVCLSEALEALKGLLATHCPSGEHLVTSSVQKQNVTGTTISPHLLTLLSSASSCNTVVT